MAPDLRPMISDIYIKPKLKWYQKILERLHIKNYWKKLGKGITGIGGK